VDFSASAARDLRQLAPSDRTRIVRFLEERVAYHENPRRLGSALTGKFAGLWRFRVGDWRIIASIEDEVVTVLILRIGHRRKIYR
jgi:mRNA interferase RelE/StbE